MKNKGLILVLTVIMVLIGMTGVASAATLSFQASDPADTTNPDFDIVAFGATNAGSKINLWIEVRGQINTHPEDGYMNAYVIDISGNQDYEIASMWINNQGNIEFIGWFSVEGNSNPLTSSDYTISGNKITYHIDADMLSDVGDDYEVTVTTAHIKGDNPTFATSHLDEAEYYSNPQSGGSGSEGNNNGEENMETIYAMGALIGYLICGVIWIIVWILVAWWAYKDAKSKCMDSPIIWFLVVLLLGIIGIIIYLIIRKDQCQPQGYNIPPPPS